MPKTEPSITAREPVALGYLAVLLLNALLTGLTVFDVVDLTGEQIAWAYMALNAVVLLVAAVKTRSVVFSPATVARADIEAEIPHEHA